MKSLWTEAYRPKTINGYVFRDQAQREQVLRWINEKSIPSLLFTGHPGTGKCLCGNEEINILIDLSTLSDEQIKALEKYKI
jgi:replication factor C small subunit